MNRLFSMLHAASVSMAVMNILERHYPNFISLIMDPEWDLLKPEGQLRFAVNRETLTKAQKSRLNRYIRHKRKTQYWRTHLSIALEWNRKELGL